MKLQVVAYLNVPEAVSLKKKGDKELATAISNKQLERCLALVDLDRDDFLDIYDDTGQYEDTPPGLARLLEYLNSTKLHLDAVLIAERGVLGANDEAQTRIEAAIRSAGTRLLIEDDASTWEESL